MKTIICSTCDGSGTVKDTDQNSQTYEHQVQCSQCNCTGRQLTSTYELTFPFTEDSEALSEFYSYDNKIHMNVNTATRKIRILISQSTK